MTVLLPIPSPAYAARMASWNDVAKVAGGLPGATPGFAHDGESPTYDVGRHPFARLRWEDGFAQGREILQFWVADAGAARAIEQSEPEAVVVVHAFTKKAAVWVWLDCVDADEVRELVADSWAVRAPRRAVRDHLG
jgi:hypothetical protein